MSAPHPTEPPTGTPPVRVVLAGARGHGRWHLENVRRLEEAGRVRLVGVCELTPLEAGELAGPPVAQSADFAALLESTGAEAAVVCTPIQAHAPMAVAAAERGVHLLLEKPPAATLAEFTRIADAARGAGTACQIGFQSLGSHAVAAVRELAGSGAIGAVTGVGAAGAWARDEAYWSRAPWAGRRRLGSRDVVDGVLTNPLAHAVATALALAGGERAEDVTDVRVELLRANDIEADDTSCVRIRTAAGVPVVAALTLCAEQPGEPYVVVHGERGRITFWYKQDRVRLERAGHEAEETVHGRTDLLENLVAHLRQGADLLVPPERTGGFMRLLEAVRLAPAPRPLPASAVRVVHDGPAPRRVVPGVEALVASSAQNLRLFSETETPWSSPTAVGAP
ncbi:Gfo/Idh/MocA family oxidoreductase [Streptomyces sp. TRM 70351]|uniref:Gfo/Idh/MocA family protein n=1 Tax=Streptomyces sp. TRM 70351 TaxID=3116552 RepID=UPI002E7AE0FD|nr:Gfo/Idh/MocA family oxidoreductase [Streptomyces sp. TRM 70351]MEE1928293.1 Gfo/Idh/MocA family oxidoreductase [Streptomyces sp. TRM 70351]